MLGDWQRKNIQYRELTYSKALERVTKEKKPNTNKPSEENSFILDETELPQIISHAMGTLKIEGEEIRYYGVKLNQNVKRIIGKGKEKKEVIIPQKVEALVLENGQIISKYNKPKGLNFEFDSIMTLKRNRWSLDSIKSFVEGEYKKEDYSFKEVFDNFKKHYDRSMVYECETWYKLDSVWDITTYLHDLIDKFLFIKHEGITGTAKSKGMKISANLSFNGKKFLCPTPANFFRYRHNNKATLMIEEAERLFDTSKKQSTGDSELVEYLNGSYEKGNSVPRQNDKNINQTDEFDPAGFTRIGAINELRGALQQRSLPKHMIKAPKGDKRGNVEIPAETDIEFCNSRDSAYICCLLYYKDYLKALDEVENKYNLANRQWVISRPLLATARCISLELENEIGNFLAESFENRDENFDDKSWEKVLAVILVKLWCNKRGIKFISAQELNMIFSNSIGKESFSPDALGKLMSKLGFSDYKKRNSSGTQRGYEMDFAKVCEILVRQNYLSEEIIIKKVSEVSECQYKEGEIREILSDTSLTPDTLNKTEENFLTLLTDRTLVSGVENSFSSDFEQINAPVEKVK
jgi:hypothetical protein